MTSFSRFLLLCPVAVVLLCGCRSHHFSATETISTARIDGVSTLDAYVTLIAPALAAPSLPASAASTPRSVNATLPDTARIIIHARTSTTATSRDTTTQEQQAVSSAPVEKKFVHAYGFPTVDFDSRLVYILAAVGLAFWLLLWHSLTKKL